MILLNGSKDWESGTLREELEVLKPRLNLTIVHVLTDPPDGWTGEKGFITPEVFKRHLHLQIPFRTSQFRVGETTMRRIYANKWIFANSDPDVGSLRTLPRKRRRDRDLRDRL